MNTDNTISKDKAACTLWWRQVLLALAAVTAAAPMTFGQDQELPHRRRFFAGDQGVADIKTPVVSETALLQLVHDDLQAVHECDRPFVRYFVFRHNYTDAGQLHFVGNNPKTLMLALVKLTNSLSWSPSLVSPSLADHEGGFIWRIDLRDYQWDAKTWDKILAAYPYGVAQGGAIAQEVTAATQCKLPYVRGDWFAFAASRSPLYYDLLGIPATQCGLESLLRIDVKEDIYRGRILRSGFNKSGISKNNRLVEWHKTGYGAFWKTYDFSGNTGQRDLLTHPTGPSWGDDQKGFRNDGGEIIFNLPNHLQAYMLVDHAGNRLDAAPINIVADTNNPRDPVIRNGASCFGCHTEGIKSIPADEVRAHVEAAPAAYDVEEVAAVRAIHAPKETTDSVAIGLSQLYLGMIQVIGGPGDSNDPIQRVSFLYQSELTMPIAAAEVGLTPKEFSSKLDAASPAIKRVLASLQSANGMVQRQEFSDVFPQIVREWGLGEFQEPKSSDSGDFTASSSTANYSPGDQPNAKVPGTKVEPYNPYIFWGVCVSSVVFIPLTILFVVFWCRLRSDHKKRIEKA